MNDPGILPLPDGVCVIQMDFAKQLMTPRVTSQDYYYASKLTTYTLGIYCAETKHMFAYMWPQHIGSKGLDETMSCLAHFIRHSGACRKWLITYSDNCPSQFKCNALMWFFQNQIDSGILQRCDVKFFSEGHSFNAVDRRFAMIEQEARKYEIISTPRDWASVIQSATLSNDTTVIQMQRQDFGDYSNFLHSQFTERTLDINGNKFSFRNLHHINFGIGETELGITTRHSEKVWARKTLHVGESPIVIDFRKKRQAKKIANCACPRVEGDCLQLPEKTLADILKLSDKYLSPNAKAFYRDLEQQQKLNFP